MVQPLYTETFRTGALEEKARRAAEWLTACRLCPRECGVDRAKGELGFCRTGVKARLSSVGPHFGEETPLVGRFGSGTIFFAWCNLGCIFCQNYELSHEGEGREVEPDRLGRSMLDLQEAGCHNINLVTPTHVVPMILEALLWAVPRGLHLPLVYNCGGYEALGTLGLLDGVVDIYMPDFKFWDSAAARDLCQAGNYAEVARAALREMHRQVGDLILGAGGVAERGLLVRHLVMPGGVAGTREIMEFIARELSPRSYVNVMDQYRPCGQALQHPPIHRRLDGGEYRQAVEWARQAGLTRLDREIGRRPGRI